MEELTRGAVTHIYNTKDTSTHPVLQIIELKRISSQNANPNSAPRFRLAVSDGEKFQQAMLATQLNQLVLSEKLLLHSLVRLQDYICNEVQNKRIIIILNLDVLGKLPAKLGNPVAVDGHKQEAVSRQPMIGVTTANQSPAAQHRTSMAGAQPAQQTAPSFSATPGANTSAWNAIPPQNVYQNRGVKPETRMPYGRTSSGIMSTAVTGPAQVYRPIQSINPYQNGWTIRGRCTYKSDLRKFQNQRGEGQVISFELTDESGSIRITAFTDHAPKVQETVMMGRVYSVTRGSLKHANEKYNRSTSPYEMTLDKKSEFTEIPDDGSALKIKYNFTKIASLDNIEVKGACDVLAIVQEVGPLSEIIIRSTGEPCNKRSVVLCDDSNSTVEITLWRNQAETFLTEADQNRHPVILVKNALRGDYGGVCLNVGRNTSLELDPINVPEANQLRAWYDSRASGANDMQSLTASRTGSAGKISGERKSLEEARKEDVDPVFSGGGGGASAMFITRGYVSLIKSDGEISYPSDPDTKKKVAPVSAGVWHSPSTDRQLRDDEVVHRYIINLKISDHSGSQWMSAFDEAGQVIMNRPAGEMRRLKETDPPMYESVVDDCKFRPLVLKVQVKEQNYRNENHIRYTVSRCEPLDFAAEGQVLLQEINSYGS